MATKFYLDGRPSKKGDHPIRVSIIIGDKRLVTSVGYSIAPDKWTGNEPRKKSEPPQRVKHGSSNAKGETYSVINAKLNEIESVFLDYEIDFQRKKIKEVDIRGVWAENFGKKKITVEEITIFDRMDEFVNEQGAENNWSKSVYNKFKTLKKQLKEFNKNLTFDYWTREGLNEYVQFMLKVQVGGKKTEKADTRVYGMKNSTIKKQLSFLKWFLRWATAKGYNTEMAFDSFKPKLTSNGNRIVFLTWDELLKVYNYDFGNREALDNVRDVFCFCSFTSLRYSDVANLKRSNVYDEHIEITTMKTADALTIELNDYSKAILKKYENEVYPYDLALPVISNQKMNVHLKEIAEICGIDEPITLTYYKGGQRYDETYPKYSLICTHTARRTFISNAIMMGIAPEVVMQWTGHSTYSAMKPYIEIADKERANAMKLFNKR